MMAIEKLQKYFVLNSDCLLVKGAKRGALYNLGSGDVYSIDPVAVSVIEGCESHESIQQIADKIEEASQDEILEFLNCMVKAGMGQFADHPINRGKINLQHKRYDRLDFAWFELREDCNLRCKHCYCKSGDSKDAINRLTFEEWQHLLEEAAELGCQAVQFIGGEPFLFGDKLFDLAKRAIELGYKDIAVFSNLTFLKDEWIDKLVEYKMSVACSLYSKRPEIHDLVTGIPGSFQRTMDNVRRLRERSINPRFGVVVMKHNQDYLEETINFLKELEATEMGYDYVRPCGRGSDEELVPDKLIKNAYQTQAWFTQIDRNTFIRNCNGNSCWQGKIAISSTGNAYPCIMQRNAPAGNVREQSLKDIILGGIRKYWDLSHDKVEVCRDCEYRYACQDCRSVAYGLTGNLTAKTPYCTYNPYRGEFEDIPQPVCCGSCGTMTKRGGELNVEVGEGIGSV